MPWPTKKQPWRTSPAKKQLIKDLKDGTIPLDAMEMSPLEVYRSRELYQEHDCNRFRDRLREYRKQISEKKDHSYQDHEALKQDCRLHPKASHDHRGIPQWEGSEAEKQLQQEVQNGNDQACMPRELWELNGEYQKYPLAVFRGHIYQERHRQKFLKWLKSEEEGSRGKEEGREEA
jgi:hypothetical protein